MSIAEVETKEDLQAWIIQFMPEAKVELSSEGIVIKTGMDVAMGGYLYPISQKEDA
jgi:hypothetical protein